MLGARLSLSNVPRESWSESSSQEGFLEMGEGCWALEGLIGSGKTKVWVA